MPRPTGTTATTVVAAGAVCWRLVDDKVRVLLIHREFHHDVSLPKGKVDPGESTPQTAVREIAEETGYRVALGAPLGTAEYLLPGGRDKIVHYWAAEVTDEAFEAAGTFVPNSEVQLIEWVPLAKARTQLTYERDAEVLDRFADRVATDTARTFAIVALRHAKAVPPGEWSGADATRPLHPAGRKQAKSVAPGIAAWRPERIISSTAARCLATVEPLSAASHVGVKHTDDISQDAFEAGTDDVAAVVKKRLKKRVNAVLCSHGPVLPEIVRQIALQTRGGNRLDLRRYSSLGTADYTVLHVSRADGTLVAVETHGPEL
ncbi:putative 8-oxo-dGTP diphosphatase 1 [Frondihabitans sp. 762G35]|uniref:NUDIX hydrolase n=1 Tax=Frondihabitans sp. 762G35 TaxID=1446794 RepID=UPI000D227BB1|nr:NUDIX domain-containing protein [Frondihabitans sp. 762G35]ARC55881.1 putative 8-oxo-dGTP diphosphatase 1 [Frondihabitans sp. 762G35]